MGGLDGNARVRMTPDMAAVRNRSVSEKRDHDMQTVEEASGV
jgi:hypothetical protein